MNIVIHLKLNPNCDIINSRMIQLYISSSHQNTNQHKYRTNQYKCWNHKSQSFLIAEKSNYQER